MAEWSRVLVFDIGGSGLRASLYDTTSDELGPVVAVDLQAMARIASLNQALAKLSDIMLETSQALLQGQRPTAVAVGFPGPVDAQGTGRGAPTLWGGHAGHSLPLGETFQSIWPGVPVTVMNDVTAAGYGLVTAERRDFFIINVGSGIGNKLFLDAAPVIGSGARGGEIGHLTVETGQDALLCDCGEMGHLGAQASGRGVLRATHRQAMRDPAGYAASALSGQNPETLDNAALAEAFRNEDPWTVAIVARAAGHLGRVIGAVHLAIGVERFVITGGFALALGDGLQTLLGKTAAANTWESGFDWAQAIHLDEQGFRTNLLGAGRAVAGASAAA